MGRRQPASTTAVVWIILAILLVCVVLPVVWCVFMGGWFLIDGGIKSD